MQNFIMILLFEQLHPYGSTCGADQPAHPHITKTSRYNFDLLNSHFYIVKLGFTGVRIIFLLLLKNRLWVLVSTASPMAVLTVTNNPFLGQKKKHISEFFIGKFSCFGVVVLFFFCFFILLFFFVFVFFNYI